MKQIQQGPKREGFHIHPCHKAKVMLSSYRRYWTLNTQTNQNIFEKPPNMYVYTANM